MQSFLKYLFGVCLTFVLLNKFEILTYFLLFIPKVPTAYLGLGSSGKLINNHD